MQNKFITICTVAAFAIVIGTMVSGSAFAKISPPSCETQSGQQPTCQGGGLKQQPEMNLAGHAPPIQQP